MGNNQVRYDAYGNQLYGTLSLLPTDYRYTGEKQAGTGFYQMGARWYDPYIAQWIEPDSIVPDLTDPQSLNRYSYALNNPLRYTDPSGHDVGCPGCDDSEVVAGGGLGVAGGGSEASWDFSVYGSVVPDWAGRLGSPVVLRPEELAQASASDSRMAGGVAAAAVAASLVFGPEAGIGIEGVAQLAGPAAAGLTLATQACSGGDCEGEAAGADQLLPRAAQAVEGAAAKASQWSASNFGPDRPGTSVPETFDLQVGNNTYQVVANATKHMAEYAGSVLARGDSGQFPINPLADAVAEAEERGLDVGKNFLKIDNWELGIDTIDNHIFHWLWRGWP